MSKRLKVLVFDNNSINLKAALAQLADYDVTLAATYDDAENALMPRSNEDGAIAIFVSKFGDDNITGAGLSDEEKKSRKDFFNVAWEQVTIYPTFDVVLSDLLVPASAQSLSDTKLAGQEMPVGLVIGLLAAKNKVPLVAVFTDSDHHSHPASACFDAFNLNGSRFPIPIPVGDSKLVLVNNPNWVECYGSDDLTKPLEVNNERGDFVFAKNWRAVLDYLLSLK